MKVLLFKMSSRCYAAADIVSAAAESALADGQNVAPDEARKG